MSHSITAKLNKPARQHQNEHGVTFFVDLGERVYNRKTRENEYTNYSAALFAKDTQIQFYADALVEGAVIEVSCTGLLIEMPDDPQYKPRLQMQDSKLGFVHSGQQPQQRQSAPQVQPGTQQQASPYADITGQPMQGSPQQPAGYTGQQGVNNGQPQPLPNEFDEPIPF